MCEGESLNGKLGQHFSAVHTLAHSQCFFTLFTRFEGGGDALWNHAEEVPCLQCDPPACQPSNVSQHEALGVECVDWEGGGGGREHGPRRMRSPTHDQTNQMPADSSLGYTVTLSHQLVKYPFSIHLQYKTLCIL